MSRRIISILREEAVDVEQYSIDEAFIFPPTTTTSESRSSSARFRPERR
jgi:nucleotidyltransferase/DNA polymerase involved in DNA repair